MGNLLKKLISTTSIDRIREITSPLEKIGINSFVHDITFEKGEVAILPDHSEILEFYYKNDYPLVCRNDEGRTLDSGIYIDKKLKNDYGDYNKIFPTISKNFNFNHLIHLFTKDQDCQHLYSFGSNLNEVDFLHSLTNNINTLTSFIKHYSLCARDIIDEAKKPKNRLRLPYFNKESEKDFSSRYSDAKKTLFSKREIECLQLTMHGKTAKQIARILEISHRTVEEYLTNIKIKTHSTSKSELIEKAFDYFKSE